MHNRKKQQFNPRSFKQKVSSLTDLQQQRKAQTKPLSPSSQSFIFHHALRLSPSEQKVAIVFAVLLLSAYCVEASSTQYDDICTDTSLQTFSPLKFSRWKYLALDAKKIACRELDSMGLHVAEPKNACERFYKKPAKKEAPAKKTKQAMKNGL